MNLNFQVTRLGLRMKKLEYLLENLLTNDWYETIQFLRQYLVFSRVLFW